jgi:hypothetical protein
MSYMYVSHNIVFVYNMYTLHFLVYVPYHNNTYHVDAFTYSAYIKYDVDDTLCVLT